MEVLVFTVIQMVAIIVAIIQASFRLERSSPIRIEVATWYPTVSLLSSSESNDQGDLSARRLLL